MKRILYALTACLSLALLVGCRTVTTGTPATAPDPYQRAAGLMVSFSADVLQVVGIEQTLYASGAYSQSTHETIRGGFYNVGVYGKQLDALILSQASAQTITAKVADLIQKLSILNVGIGAMNAEQAAQMQASIKAMTLLLNQISLTFGTDIGELHDPSTNRSFGGATLDARLTDLPAARGAIRRKWYADQAARRRVG